MLLRAAIVWLLLSFLSPEVHSLPEGFFDEGVTRLHRVTGFNFAPNILRQDGSSVLLATDRRGYLWVFPDLEGSPRSKRLILDVSDNTCYNGERGFTSVLAHPNFLKNRHIYVYYTANKFQNCGTDSKDGPVNRVSRFTMSANSFQIDKSTEKILLETSALKSIYHNGGGMEFGNDGYLYVSIGKSFSGFDLVMQIAKLFLMPFLSRCCIRR